MVFKIWGNGGAFLGAQKVGKMAIYKVPRIFTCVYKNLQTEFAM